MQNIFQQLIISFVSNNKISFSLYLFLVLVVLIISSIVIPISLSKVINIKLNVGNSLFFIIISVIITFILLYFFKNKFQNYLLVKLSSFIQSNVIKIIIENLNNKLDISTISEITNYSNVFFWGFRVVFKYIIENLIPYIIFNFILITYFYFTKNYSILTILILQFIIVFLTLKNNFNKQIKLGSDIEESWIEYSKNVGEKIDNLEHIFFNDTLNYELNKLRKPEIKLDETSLSFYKFNNLIELKLNLVIYIFFIIIISLIIYKKISKSKNNLSILMFILIIYLTNFSNLIKETMFIFHNFSKIYKINKYLVSIRDKNKKYKSKDQYINITFFDIEFKNLYFSYNKYKQRLIFKNLNIKIIPHKINVIKGRSGSGKTTLIKLLFRKVNPISGIIKGGQYNLNNLPIKAIFDNIYYVNQKTNLLNLSIYENINYGNNYSKNEVLSLLNKYSLHTVFRSLSTTSNYLEFNVINSGSNLSLGMQKVIILLRGILKKNKNIIIFDEPLSSLDQKTSLKIIKMMLEEKKHKTYVIISHDNYFNQYSQNNIFI